MWTGAFVHPSAVQGFCGILLFLFVILNSVTQQNPYLLQACRKELRSETEFKSKEAWSAAPMLFAQLLTYWSAGDSGISRTTAVYYATGMVACSLISSILHYHAYFYSQQFGMKLRIATSSLMFRKIFRMSNMSMNDSATGKVVNLLSNDLQRFDFAFIFLHHTWIVPLQLALVCYLGFTHAGIAAVMGVITLLVLALPLQVCLGKLSGILRLRVAEKTNARIKVMNEVINGIQVIKMYAWEIPFEKVIDSKRKDELDQVRYATILRSALMGCMIYMQRTAMFITILTYRTFNNKPK